MAKGKDNGKKPDGQPSSEPPKATAAEPNVAGSGPPEGEPGPGERAQGPAAPSIGKSSSDAQPDGPPRQRFVVSQLLSGHPTRELRRDARDVFSTRLERVLLPEVDVVSDISPEAQSDHARRVVVIEADPKDLRAKLAAMTADTVVEPELLRVPALAYPAELTAAAVGADNEGPGTGATLSLTLQGNDGDSLPPTRVIVRFNGTARPSDTTLAGGVTDGAGQVSVAFDPNRWRPTFLIVEPGSRYWSAFLRMPQSGQTPRLVALPQNGPYGWWQLLSGAVAYDPAAGAGIKVGIIDTGAGPHPNLDHVVPVGAFLDGNFLAGEAQGRDVQIHGTHVSGIIGARPRNAGEYAGLAPGAEIYMARVFAATGGGNQGDIAQAIDMLSSQQGVDLINMSLTGASSNIERDAVILAYRRGTLCVCAAGNQNGSPVGYPAAYPESIAVSALGLAGSSPPESLAALNAPAGADHFGIGGLFLANFSNIGPELYCAAPGNGIISTVPSSASDAAPYADMSGTSMASPMVAGVLAALLGRDPAYRGMEPNTFRSVYAKSLLARHALQVGLRPIFQGWGMARLT